MRILALKHNVPAAAGRDIAFERKLDALNQALESIARHRDRQSSEVGRASEATASDSELPEF